MSTDNDNWTEGVGPDSGVDATTLWDCLRTTDPAATKEFSRPGGFKGTAVDPAWRVRRLTEELGPCGVGWGFDVKGHGIEGQKSPIHWVLIRFWYVFRGHRGEFDSFGSTPIMMERKQGAIADEEYPKKSLTDALMTAAARIGMSADVYEGSFDGDKYGRAEAPQRPQDARQAPGRPQAPPASQGAPRAPQTPAAGAQGKGGPEQRCPQCGAQGRTPRNFDPASNRPDLECPAGCKGNAKQDGKGFWPLNWWSFPKGTAPAVQAAIEAQAPPADGDPDAWRSGPPQEW